jgi:hypothetical protein
MSIRAKHQKKSIRNVYYAKIFYIKIKVKVKYWLTKPIMETFGLVVMVEFFANT